MMAKIIQDIESIQKIKVLIVNRTCTITLSVDKSLFSLWHTKRALISQIFPLPAIRGNNSILTVTIEFC